MEQDYLKKKKAWKKWFNKQYIFVLLEQKAMVKC